jgi:hypothetical protein
MSRRPAATATASTKPEAAADALLAWLQTQPTRTASHREPTDPATGLHVGPVEPDPRFATASQPSQPDLSGAEASALSHDPTRRERGSALRPDHTDWLHHRLLVTGPAADLVRLRSAAAGAGTVPWHLDFDHMEEDLFHLLVAPPARTGALEYRARSLSLAGARILAGQLRTAAERRHGLAIAQIGHSRVCPFDLHALVPVPDAILKCGPDDPEALDWLWTHWGTTQTLRLVVEDEAATITTRPAGAGQGAAAGQGVWALTFWSADWTPWRALAQVAGSWPTLRFETRPIYDMP